MTSPGAADAVAAMLWDLRVGGVAEDRLSPSAVRLRCYLPPSRARAVTLRLLRARVRGLARYGLDSGRSSVACRTVEIGRWARAWRKAMRPVHLGRLIIAPTWARVPPRPGRIVVRIDPGMAFGSGAHPSTRLCLRALLRYLRPADRARGTVADVGTGSGVLAIAAARLGAAQVRARDIDPEAVAIARANVRANGVAGRVSVVRGSGVGNPPVPAALIVANIVADTIIPMLPEARARLAPGGLFIGSGIVADRLDEVLAAAGACGFRRVEVLASGEWRAVVLAARDSDRLEVRGRAC